MPLNGCYIGNISATTSKHMHLLEYSAASWGHLLVEKKEGRIGRERSSLRGRVNRGSVGDQSAVARKEGGAYKKNDDPSLRVTGGLHQ